MRVADSQGSGVSLLVFGGVDVSRDSVSLSDTSTGELDSDDVLVSGKLDDEVGVEIDTGGGTTEVREERGGGGEKQEEMGERVREPGQPSDSEPLSSEIWR